MAPSIKDALSIGNERLEIDTIDLSDASDTSPGRLPVEVISTSGLTPEERMSINGLVREGFQDDYGDTEDPIGQIEGEVNVGALYPFVVKDSDGAIIAVTFLTANEEIQGFQYPDQTFSIRESVTSPDYRGRGIITATYQRVLRYIRENTKYENPAVLIDTYDNAPHQRQAFFQSAYNENWEIGSEEARTYYEGSQGCVTIFQRLKNGNFLVQLQDVRLDTEMTVNIDSNELTIPALRRDVRTWNSLNISPEHFQEIIQAVEELNLRNLWEDDKGLAVKSNNNELLRIINEILGEYPDPDSQSATVSDIVVHKPN
jgi:GNAT superfamily N-acetyltransferase